MMAEARENLLLLYLIEEENEEDSLLMLNELKRSKHNELYILRETEGFENILVKRHLLKDDEMFRKYFRLNIDQFNYILSIVEKEIEGQSCNHVKHPISPAEKLGITLRFLATGESYASLSFAFRISKSYISRIVKQVLKVCSQKLPPILMPDPTKNHLIAIAKEFEEKWNFPNCISAVDGKHVRIFCPGKSGSLFYNYKDYFSVVLLAFVDANYKFIMVDIGSYGKEGDSGIIEKSNIGKLIRNEDFYPPPRHINGSFELPHIIVGDEAFKLSTHMMKPYARNVARQDYKKAVFNYRLSRARRVSENAFALLSQVFRIFYVPIAVNPEVTDNLVMTACCLHNMLRDAYLEKNNVCFFGSPQVGDFPTENLLPIRAGGGFGNLEGFATRERFTDYFNSNIGTVSWQSHQIRKTDVNH